MDKPDCTGMTNENKEGEWPPQIAGQVATCPYRGVCKYMLHQIDQDYEARNPVEYKHEMPGLSGMDKVHKEVTEFKCYPPPLAPE